MIGSSRASGSGAESLPTAPTFSPDGQHMIYFAMGGVEWAIPATGGTWTAISELPSLKASALWGQGDTRGGGGMFILSIRRHDDVKAQGAKARQFPEGFSMRSITSTSTGPFVVSSTRPSCWRRAT